MMPSSSCFQNGSRLSLLGDFAFGFPNESPAAISLSIALEEELTDTNQPLNPYAQEQPAPSIPQGKMERRQENYSFTWDKWPISGVNDKWAFDWQCIRRVVRRLEILGEEGREFFGTSTFFSGRQEDHGRVSHG